MEMAIGVIGSLVMAAFCGFMAENKGKDFWFWTIIGFPLWVFVLPYLLFQPDDKRSTAERDEEYFRARRDFSRLKKKDQR